MAKESLADAAAEALPTGDDEDRSEQLAIVPACKVKFVGMSWDSLDDVPGLKDQMEFRVEGIVVGHGQTVMANGEIRDVATVKVTSVSKVE
jgi:hypothetical protein